MAEQKMVSRLVHTAVTTCENLHEYHYVIIPMSPSHDYLNWKIHFLIATFF